ncbi:MAG: hypothetical protein KDE47_26710, partial [Caldilineaceae bacterium]|nr:hypothetical protein [Caldilineaceae bacterium]
IPKSVAPIVKIPKASTICIASIDMRFPPKKVRLIYEKCELPEAVTNPLGAQLTLSADERKSTINYPTKNVHTV